MSSTYSTRLRITFQTTGENDSTWGSICNEQSLQLLEDGISGSATFSMASGNVTLTANNGAADQARMAILLPTGVLTANRDIIVPTVAKHYLVYNNTSAAYTVTVKTSAGTGVTVTQGSAQWVFCDATNVLATAVKTAVDATNVTTTINSVAISSYARRDAGTGTTAQTYTKGQATTGSPLTDAANIALDSSLSNVFRVTLTANRTLDNPTNPADGQAITIYVKQDGAGTRTLAYGTAWEFSGDVAPILTTTAGKMDVICATYDSALSKWYASIIQNFSTT